MTIITPTTVGAEITAAGEGGIVTTTITHGVDTVSGTADHGVITIPGTTITIMATTIIIITMIIIMAVMAETTSDPMFIAHLHGAQGIITIPLVQQIICTMTGMVHTTDRGQMEAPWRQGPMYVLLATNLP